MRLIYDNGGMASVLTPTLKFLAELEGTLEEKLIHIANKDLPTGTKYEIIADSVDLSDRTFRDAWTINDSRGCSDSSVAMTDSSSSSQAPHPSG